MTDAAPMQVNVAFRDHRQPAARIRDRVGQCFLAAALLSILPVVAAHSPPLHDYPFHIARMYVLAHWHDSSMLQEHYTLGSFILPNVAMDVIVVGLSHVMSIEIAGRVFICLTIVLQISGCIALYRAIHGHYALWPLTSALFIYNWIFIFGFMNYLFGVGVLLWSMAIWISLPDPFFSPRTTVSKAITVRFVVGTALAVVLFFCHVIAFGLFGVAVAAYELRRAFLLVSSRTAAALQTLILGASIFIVPLVLFALSSTARVEGSTSHRLINLLRTPAIFVRILLSADWPLDVILMASVAALLMILVFRGKVIVAPSMRFVIALLVLTFLAMPHQLGGDWAADSRIPVVIIFVLIASVRPVLDAYWARLAFLLVAGTLIVRTGLLTYDWARYDEIIGGIRRAFAVLPENSTLIAATEEEVPSLQDINLRLWHPPLPHVATYAIIDRNVFVPQLWAKRGVQPLWIKPRYQQLYNYVDTDAIHVTTSLEAVEKARELAAPSPVYVLLLYPYHDMTLPAGASVLASGRQFVLLSLSRNQLNTQ